MTTPTKTGQTTQGASTQISDRELAELLWKTLWERAGADGGLIKTNITDEFEKVLKDKRPAVLEYEVNTVNWDDIGWTYWGGSAVLFFSLEDE